MSMSQVMLQDHKFGLARYVAGTLICSTVWPGTAAGSSSHEMQPPGRSTAYYCLDFKPSLLDHILLFFRSNMKSIVAGNFTQEPQ
jgi:hypothetical protein